MTVRLLFATSWLLAGSIGGLVLFAPWLTASEGGLGRLVRLFAEDVLVRRTATACAVGLAVTAHVFFLADKKEEPPESAEQGEGGAEPS